MLRQADSAADARVTLHERFGTASVECGTARVDIAERRSESYSTPGALPDVRPADLEEDLARRDFTVNAIAVALEGERRGELRAVDGARRGPARGEAARAARRELHAMTRRGCCASRATPGAWRSRSRSGRWRWRAPRSRTARSQTVSGARIAAELWLCAKEPGEDALAMLGELGVLGALGFAPHFDRSLARAAQALLPRDGDTALLRMAVVLRPVTDDGAPARAAGARLLDALEVQSATRERVIASAFGVEERAAALVRDPSASELHALFAGLPPEAVALAAAFAARSVPGAERTAHAWFDRVRHVTLAIDGRDLLAAGVPEGPEIGRGLARALARKLDGELGEDRDAELAAALEAAR